MLRAVGREMILGAFRESSFLVLFLVFFFLVVVFCFAFRSFQLRALPLLLLHLHLLLPLPAASSARPFCFCLLDFFCVLFSPLSLSLSICVASSPAFQSELSDAPTDPPPLYLSLEVEKIRSKTR